MNTRREHEIVAVFLHWLRSDGWEVSTEVAWADVAAVREGERFVCEVKGKTSEVGLDVDTVYGQLLRRMADESGTRYAIVVPSAAIRAALRVPERVRERLGITVYEVAEDDTVTAH